MAEISDDEEKSANTAWAIEGTITKGFDHLLAEPTADPPPNIQNEMAVKTRPPAVPLKNEMIVSTMTEDVTKTLDLTDCEDPFRPVQKYNSYYRVEQMRYKEGQRPIPSTFQMTISTTRLESYLMSGC